MEVHKSTNTEEEWVWEGGGWKKKKMAPSGNASGATADTVKVNAPSRNANSNSTNEIKNVATPSTSQSQLGSLKKHLPWTRSSSAGTAVSAAASKFSYTSSVVTPKKSNANTNTNAKRFNPASPFTSSARNAKQTENSATDTPDTVGMSPDADDADDGDELDAFSKITCTVPVANIRLIQAAYGGNANLYTEVLQVQTQFAKEQEIRIAYFRRGRQVLAEQQQDQQRSNSGEGTASIADLSIVAKQRFQAVSMAYEILSQPSSKQLYDRVGLERLLKYAQEADKENDDACVPNVWGKNTSANANSGSPILRRRNSFEDRTGSSTDRLGRSATTSGRTPPSTVARTAVDSAEVAPQGSSAAIRWSEDVEELYFDQDPEERAFKSGAPVIVAQGGGGGGDESYNYDTHVKSLDRATESTAKVLVNKFLDDVDASLDNIEVGFDDLVKYVSDGEDEDDEEKELQQPKSQKAEVSPKPKVNRFKAGASNKPTRTTSSRVLAYLQAAKPQDENERVESAERVNREPNSRSSNDDVSQDMSQDADDLFVTLMKSAPTIKKDETIVLSRGTAENQFLEKARKDVAQRRNQSMTDLPSKFGTPFAEKRLKLKKPKIVGLERLEEDQELGESFLPRFQSDTPADGPANMLIRTKAKKSFRKLRDGSDSISAITETTNMPQPRAPKEYKESKLTDCVRTFTHPALMGMDGSPLVEQTEDICLNTTLGSDPFCGVEDETAMNTTTISESGGNVDFTSYFMAYMKNLTTDMYDIGNRVNTSIEATNKMFFDSIIISDDDMLGMFDHFNHDIEEDTMIITRAQTF
jgi:curved DNA-binding protein CbpA